MMNSSRCRPGVLSIADEMIEWRYALLVSPKMTQLRHQPALHVAVAKLVSGPIQALL
jgi:hypothetical protein